MNNLGNFSVQDFVIATLTRAGAVVERPSYALAEAVLPEELQPLLGSDYLLLAFDAEVAAETPESVFVTHGSPMLDKIIEVAAGFGRYIQMYLPGDGVKAPRNLESRLREAVEYRRCRPPQVVQHWQAEKVYYGFYFRCVFHSYEKTEEVISAVVDGHTGQPVDSFAKHWGNVVPLAGPEYVMPQATLMPLADLYQSAYREVKRNAVDRAGSIQQAASYLRQRELAKITSYYEETAREIEQKFAGAVDLDKKVRLEKQLAATRADQKRREEDAARRYNVEVELRLDHLVAHHLPCLFVRAAVQYKDRVLHHTLTYNPLSGEIEAPVCPRCGQVSRCLTPDGDELVCPSHWDGRAG